MNQIQERQILEKIIKRMEKNILIEAKRKDGVHSRTVTESPQDLNIAELFKKLVESGLVTNQKAQNISRSKEDSSACKPVVVTPSRKVSAPRRDAFGSVGRISFDNPETLKIRQIGVHSSLYLGMQCSSCGMRFSKAESKEYTQHLDWHFRHNRKAKSIHAANRQWLCDWSRHGEVEEQREKNFFDQEKAAVARQKIEVKIPTVVADPNSAKEYCEVCRDQLDLFFNEEKEEWHLKNSIRIENKPYHPICYEDFQESNMDQTLDESAIQSLEPIKQEEAPISGLSITVKDEDNNREITSEGDESERKDAGENETEKPLDEDGNDSVILIEAAPIIIVIDDDAEEMPHTSNESEMTGKVGVVSAVPTSRIGGDDIKMNISEPLPVMDDKEKDVGSESSLKTHNDRFDHSLVEDPKPAALKSELKGVRLMVLPPVRKGFEQSGMCSIM